MGAFIICWDADGALKGTTENLEKLEEKARHEERKRMRGRKGDTDGEHTSGEQTNKSSKEDAASEAGLRGACTVQYI